MKSADANLVALLVGVNAVVMWDTYQFTLADGSTVTLTSKDKDWIPEIPAPAPPPPAAAQFLDTFNGTAGPLSDHSPDVAPTGFVWADNSPGNNLQLDGTGNLTNPANDATEGFSAGSWSPIGTTFPFTLEFISTMEDGAGADFSSTYFYAEDPTGNHSIYLAANRLGVGSREVFLSTTDAGTSHISANVIGLHTYSAIVSAANVVVKMDGSEVGSVTGDFSALSAFAFVLVGVDTNGGFAHSIQQVSITS
jgi:hypothetical protein